MLHFLDDEEMLDVRLNPGRSRRYEWIKNCRIKLMSLCRIEESRQIIASIECRRVADVNWDVRIAASGQLTTSRR